MLQQVRDHADTDCQLYVAIEQTDNQYQFVLKEAVAAFDAAFVGESRTGTEALRMKVCVGSATAQSISDVCNDVLPCLVWVATGPDILGASEWEEQKRNNQNTRRKRSESEPIGSLRRGLVNELLQLAQGSSVGGAISVDLAIVCCIYGAEWAANMLVKKKKLARMAIWISPSAQATDRREEKLVKDTALLARELLRMATSSKKPLSIKAIEKRMKEWACSCADPPSCGLVIGAKTSLITAVAASDHPVVQRLAPRGNYFSRILTTRDDNTIGHDAVDLNHFDKAIKLAAKVSQLTKTADKATVINITGTDNISKFSFAFSLVFIFWQLLKKYCLIDHSIQVQRRPFVESVATSVAVRVPTTDFNLCHVSSSLLRQLKSVGHLFLMVFRWAKKG